jgi:PBP1b-binding outer membrane lipoprotein LpoB
MNVNMKKIIIILGAALTLSGCSLLDSFTKKVTSPTTTAPTTQPTQTETTTTEMGSPSYKVETAAPAPTSPTNPSTTTKSTQTTNDDPDDLEKELNSISIESDFGALVQ